MKLAFLGALHERTKDLYCSVLEQGDLVTYEEAVIVAKGLDEEIETITRNYTRELHLPERQKPMGVKLVYKTKTIREGK